MTTLHAEADRHFYRDADRALLGGVCAGLANHLGFNLKVTRLLAFIAFLMAMPIAVIAYLAAVCLIPAESRRNYDDRDHELEPERHFRKRRRSRREKRAARKNKDSAQILKSTLTKDINRRCSSMDRRLARLEKHVTSKRFQIDQELSRL